MRIKKWLVGLVCCLACSLATIAESESKSEAAKLEVTDAYMPPVPSVSRTGAVYLKLKNTSNSPFVLTGASTSIANHVMIHQTIESQGVVKMKHQSNIVIPAGDSVEFAPGGTHIMLMGLQKQTMPETFKVDLIFENHLAQTVEVKVRLGSEQ